MPDRQQRREPQLGASRPGAPVSAPGVGGGASPAGGRLPNAGSTSGSPVTPVSRPRKRRTLKSRLTSLALNLMLVLTAVVVAISTFLAIAPPTDLIRARLIAEVKQRTGRDLVIEGETRFTISPAMGLSARKVTLSAPAGMDAGPLLVADAIEVRVAAFSLAARDVKVESVTLRRPRIELSVDRTGRRSWDFASAHDLRSTATTRLAQASARGADGRRLSPELESFAKNATAPMPPKSSKLAALSLDRIDIAGGSISFADARTGANWSADDVDARVVLTDGPGGPVAIDGTLRQAGQPMKLAMKIASLADALDQRPTRMALEMTGKPLMASFEGTVVPGSSSGAEGRLAIKAPSANALAGLAGFELAGIEQDAIAFEGQLKTVPGGVALSDAKLSLGSLTAQGKATADLSSGRPQITAHLRLSALDTEQIGRISVRPAAVVPPMRLSQPVARPAAAQTPPPASIEDLLERAKQHSRPERGKDGPAVRGFLQRTGEDWSQEAIDGGFLRAIDLDARLEMAGLKSGKLQIGASQTSLQLKGGLLKVDIANAQLYGGRAKGLVSIDARQSMLVLGLNISADGVATQAMLRDLSGIDSIDGRGRTVVAVSATGGSERELISTLSGRAELHVADGAVVGWSATEMMAALQRAQIPSLERRPDARTPFAELAASFQIANGVARTQDIRLKSGTIESSGTGLVNIVDRNVDLTVRPRSVAGGLAGIEVPVRIAGPWGEARAVPDINAALKSPKAQEKVRQITRQLQTGNVDGALKSVIGDGPKAEEKIKKAKDALGKFLGKPQSPPAQ